MEMESWEALDVDDSDLPSLLRSTTLLPCKRQHQQQPNKPTNSNSSPILSLSLEPCFQLPRPYSQSQSKTHNPETLDSQPEQCLPQVDEKEEGPSTSARRIIPGPAGALQAAMHRQDRNNRQKFSCSQERISTQEYLRRAQEDGDEDEDFKSNSWLCAMDFLHREGTGAGDGIVFRYPLSSIKTRLSSDRVPQVVAFIKSCIPNGLGDLTVTLKDPTGTIGASIHRKVLIESEFGNNISVGAVLILHEVAVFSPSCSAQYLNITLNNVVKVFSKECGPLSKQTYPASRVRFAISGTVECRDSRTGMAERASPLRHGAPEGITNKEVRRDGNGKGTVDVDKQTEKGGPTAGSFHCSSGRSRFQHTAAEEEPLVRWGVAYKDMQEAVRNVNSKEEVNNNDRQPEEGTPLRNFHCTSSGYQHASATVDTNFVKDPNDHEAGRTNGVEKQKQPLSSRASLPVWTDEQLEELFAGGFDDGDSLF